MIIYALTDMIGQIAALAFSIDAPLQILLHNADDEYIPFWLRKRSKKGVLTNGYLLTGILVSLLIVVPLWDSRNRWVSKMDDQPEFCCDANALPLGLLCLYHAQSCLEEVQRCRIQDDQESKTRLYYWSLVLPVHGLCLYFRDGAKSGL